MAFWLVCNKSMLGHSNCLPTAHWEYYSLLVFWNSNWLFFYLSFRLEPIKEGDCLIVLQEPTNSQWLSSTCSFYSRKKAAACTPRLLTVHLLTVHSLPVQSLTAHWLTAYSLDMHSQATCENNCTAIGTFTCLCIYCLYNDWLHILALHICWLLVFKVGV